MKKILLVFALFTIVFAESQNGFFSGFGVGVGYMRYQEPGVMKTNQALLDFSGEIGYRYDFLKTKAEADYLSTFGFYSGGVLDLGGGLETHVKDNGLDVGNSFASDRIFDGRLKLGIDILAFHSNMDLFLQSGIGYWLLEDIFNAYKRTQTYLYVPIELEGEIRSSPSLAWTYLLGYKHFVHGRNRTLTKASAILDTDMFFKQDKGFGAKASFGWKEQGKNINTFTRFVIDYWNVDSSPEVPVVSTLGVHGVATEPKNYTLSIYIQHGWRF